MAKKPGLSKGAMKMLDEKVDEIFDRLKSRALGRGKRMYIGYERPLSIPGIYEQAVSDEGGKVDRDLVDRLLAITNDYLDQHRASAKASLKKRIEDLLQEIAAGQRDRESFKTVLDGELSSIWDKVTFGVKRVLEQETQHAQTIGIKQGIDEVNAAIGVNDPIVFFMPVKDDRLCDECRRVHLMPDGTTPRLWLTSEVKAGYHERGEDQPSWNLMHPHCRCTLTTLLPGYGFDPSGRVTYKQDGWDELKHQRGE